MIGTASGSREACSGELASWSGDPGLCKTIGLPLLANWGCWHLDLGLALA
jgi:hypothetical protein